MTRTYSGSRFLTGAAVVAAGLGVLVSAWLVDHLLGPFHDVPDEHDVAAALYVAAGWAAVLLAVLARCGLDAAASAVVGLLLVAGAAFVLGTSEHGFVGPASIGPGAMFVELVRIPTSWGWPVAVGLAVRGSWRRARRPRPARSSAPGPRPCAGS